MSERGQGKGGRRDRGGGRWMDQKAGQPGQVLLQHIWVRPTAPRMEGFPKSPPYCSFLMTTAAVARSHQASEPQHWPDAHRRL